MAQYERKIDLYNHFYVLQNNKRSYGAGLALLTRMIPHCSMLSPNSQSDKSANLTMETPEKKRAQEENGPKSTSG
jgi:hypothetical protein